MDQDFNPTEETKPIETLPPADTNQSTDPWQPDTVSQTPEALQPTETASSFVEIKHLVKEPQPVITTPKPKKSKKALFIILIIILVLTISAGAVWYFIFNKPITTISNSQNNVVIESDPELAKMITPTTGETWLDKPVEIAKQGYLKASEYTQPEEYTTYYSVGNRGDNDIILAVYGAIGTTVYLFEKSPAGTVIYISRPNALAIYNDTNEGYLTSDLISSIEISKDIHYDSLNIPARIIIDDKGSFVSYTGTSLGSLYLGHQVNVSYSEKEDVVKQLGKSSLIKEEKTNVDTGLVSVSYFIKTPLNTVIAMKYEPLDLDVSQYQWQSGANYIASGVSLKAITRGCSGGSLLVTKTNSITDDDVRQAGKSGNGLTVYEIKDKNNALLQKAYVEYDTGMKNGMINLKGISSVDEFMNQHAVVIYKDVNGQWLVYVRQDLAPAGGCAKPVVYLYPTMEQTVRVKVGADVKVSDPLYNPAIGWTVVAKPNGQLIVDGIQYGSLFWEGLGIGQYPNIASGTVVEQKDAVATIRQQLSQQGLNETEINDFVDYWQDKLPNKPYVRLTWFNTAQMDQLAPLLVSPRPDTMIRVFLDASGFDNPITIPAQNLASTPRIGFTVVEWGGLSSKKLY